MNWGNLLHTFELHNNQIVYQEIDTIPQIDANRFINHRQLYFYFHVKPEFLSSYAMHAEYAFSSNPGGQELSGPSWLRL